MKHYLKPVLTLATFALLAVNSVHAETEMIIALKTDNFELSETDISSLVIGEAKTIETDNGSVIDILRTADGVEIYVNGELLEMDFDHEGLHGEHMIRKHVEVICEGECDESTITILSGDEDISGWVTQDGGNVLIHKGDKNHKVIVIKKEIISQY